MKRIQSTDKLYPFKFFEIKSDPNHFKIWEQILQYVSCVRAKFGVDWKSTYWEIPVSKFIRGSPVEDISILEFLVSGVRCPVSGIRNSARAARQRLN